MLRSLSEEAVAEMLLRQPFEHRRLLLQLWEWNLNAEQERKSTRTLIFGLFCILRWFSGPLENPNCPFLPQFLLTEAECAEPGVWTDWWRPQVKVSVPPAPMASPANSKERKGTQVDAWTTRMFLSVYYKISCKSKGPSLLGRTGCQPHVAGQLFYLAYSLLLPKIHSA